MWLTETSVARLKTDEPLLLDGHGGEDVDQRDRSQRGCEIQLLNRFVRPPMPAQLPYVASNKNVGALFEKIASAKIPLREG